MPFLIPALDAVDKVLHARGGLRAIGRTQLLEARLEVGRAAAPAEERLVIKEVRIVVQRLQLRGERRVGNRLGGLDVRIHQRRRRLRQRIDGRNPPFPVAVRGCPV